MKGSNSKFRVHAAAPRIGHQRSVVTSAFRVSGFGFLVSCVWFRVSGFVFLVLCFGFLVSCFWFRVSGFVYRVSGHVFIVSCV